MPFGSKVKIPDLFGERIFIVHDRMNERYPNNLDIWMLKKSDAIAFGRQAAKVYAHIPNNKELFAQAD